MSSDVEPLPGGDDYLEQSPILADTRHRRILSLLLNRSHPLTERDLSVQLTARETGADPGDIDEEDHQSVRVALHHQCLPKLESEGWIKRHQEGFVAAEPLPVSDDDSPLPDLHDLDHPFWEAVGALLARPRRQDLVTIVAGRRDPLTLAELATALPEHSDGSWPGEGCADEPTLFSTLHHVDLPKLAEVGLIEYDPDEKTITRTRTLETFVDRTALGNRLTEESDTDY